MKEVKELLNTFKQTKQEEADLEQFNKAIVDLVRKNTVGFEKVAKKQDKKEYKPNPEMPEGFLNYVKSKEKIVGFDNYTLMIDIIHEQEKGLYWLPKHSIKHMTEVKE